MTRTVSIGSKIERLKGLVGTKDITQWQDSFIASISRQSDGGRETQHLSERQVEIVEEIWGRHFA